ncbi:hypothetical protein VTJ04DRAFT_9593 [Mycothermus thermophilus]|uniref:uncharacterized protein n=1 Tax=Humicola insolens TaxID=85995 RepID=UPI003742C09A
MHGYAVSTISRTSPGRFPDAGIRFVNVRNSILAGLAALPLLHLPAPYQPRRLVDGAHSPRSLQRLLAGSRARYPLPLVISMPSRAGGEVRVPMAANNSTFPEEPDSEPRRRAWTVGMDEGPPWGPGQCLFVELESSAVSSSSSFQSLSSFGPAAS